MPFWMRLEISTRVQRLSYHWINLYIDQGPDDLADSILSDCADTFLGLEAQMDLDKTQELQESIRPEEIS